MRDFATGVNGRTVPTFERVYDFGCNSEGLVFFPATEFAGTVGDDPVVPEEVPGGHVGDYNVGRVEGEVAVHVGRLDNVSLGTAKHPVHGCFNVKRLKHKIRPHLKNKQGRERGVRGENQVRCAILEGECILLFDCLLLHL